MADEELANPLGLTRENADTIRAFLHKMEDDLDHRRVAAGEIPKHFTTHILETFNSKTAVLMTVDQCTSGKFAYMRVQYDDLWRDVVAFEDAADMTMFQMAYIQAEEFWIETPERNYNN